jgi:hypothetical protein
MVHVLDEEASPLAVLFSFVVLLSILDEATLPMIRGGSPRQLRGLRGWTPLGAGLHLLAQPCASLGPVVTLGVILRSGLVPSAVASVGPLASHYPPWPQLPHQLGERSCPLPRVAWSAQPELLYATVCRDFAREHVSA